jgi:hypothetical protein
MITFNERGLLTPSTIISCAIEEFAYEFAVKLTSERRVHLMNQYRLFCSDLKDLCGGGNAFQWIDGSFVTKTKEPAILTLFSLWILKRQRKMEKN